MGGCLSLVSKTIAPCTPMYDQSMSVSPPMRGKLQQDERFCACTLCDRALSHDMEIIPSELGMNEDKSSAPWTLFFPLAARARALLPDGGLVASSPSQDPRPRDCSERAGSALCGRIRLHDRLRQGVCLSTARLQGLTGVGQC